MEMAIAALVEKNNFKPRFSVVWFVIFAVLSIVGAVCWGLQLNRGLHLTNLGTTNMWGLYITGFMIFTGIAAGGLFFAALPYLFQLESYKPYSRIAAYLASVSSIVAASMFIIVDVGNPARAWLFITSGNLSSPMFWDFLILGSYMVLSTIFTRQLILVQEGKKKEKSILPIAVVAFIAGILVTVTASVFNLQVSRPIWNSALQPISFLVSALVVTLAVFIILALILNKNGYIKMPPVLLSRMAKITAILLFVEIVIMISKVMLGLYPGSGHKHSAYQWLVTGNGATGFWLQVVALVVSTFLLAKKTSSNGVSLLTGAILALVAIYFVKSNFLQMELFHPPITLPGPPMYGDLVGPYFPSLLEIGLSIGIISLGALLLQIGLSILNLSTGSKK